MAPLFQGDHLWRSRAENQWWRGAVFHLQHLQAARQKVQGPVTQCSIQAQILELNDEPGGQYGVERRTVVHKTASSHKCPSPPGGRGRCVGRGRWRPLWLCLGGVGGVKGGGGAWGGLVI